MMTRAVAINYLINLTADIGKVQHSDLWGYEQVLCEIKELLECMPPERKGVWIPMPVSSGRDSWKCSVCGRRARGKRENLPFCHCGADMRKEER